jgi:hypothetical protein
MADDDISRLLGEIVANQRNMFKEQQRMNTVLEKHFDDDKVQFGAITGRMRNIEQKVNYAAGAMAVGVFILTAFWGSIMGLFRS